MLICLSMAVLAGLSAQSIGSTMYVAVKSSDLKSSTGLLAGKSGSVVYGDKVIVQSVSGAKVQVKTVATGQTGWIASSSLTSKVIVSSGGSSSASAQELALAGKGFSAETEKSYQQTGDLDYSQVDAMERLTVSDDDLGSFLSEGHLKQE